MSRIRSMLLDYASFAENPAFSDDKSVFKQSSLGSRSGDTYILSSTICKDLPISCNLSIYVLINVNKHTSGVCGFQFVEYLYKIYSNIESEKYGKYDAKSDSAKQVAKYATDIILSKYFTIPEPFIPYDKIINISTALVPNIDPATPLSIKEACEDCLKNDVYYS